MKYSADKENDPQLGKSEELFGDHGLSAQSISELSVASRKESNDLLFNWSQKTQCLLESDEDETQEYVQYAWRWVNIACIFGPILSQSCLMMIFSPITAILRDAYRTTDMMVDSNATIFFIVTFIVNIPSVYLLESGDTLGKGMSTWFKRACIFTILGQWGRYMAIVLFPNQFWFTIFPAGMIALGQSFFQNGISKLACIWFGDHQRAIAVGILTFGFALGSCIGFSIGSFFVFEQDKEDHDKIKEQTSQFMWFISWATTILCLPAIFFYEQKPPTYPSISAKKSANLLKKRQIKIMDELPILWQNKNFRYTFLIFTLMNGSMNSLSSILTFLIEPFGFDSNDSSLLGVTCVLTGFISAIMFPIMIQKYRWYLKSMKIMAFGGLVAQIAIMLSLELKSLNYSLVAIGLFGLFNIPTTSIVFSFAMEVTYPVSETLFACLFQAGSCLFSSLMTYASLYLIDNVSATCVTIIFVIFYATCSVIVFFLTEDLRRLKLSSNQDALY